MTDAKKLAESLLAMRRNAQNHWALIRKECIAVAGWSFNEPMHSLQRLKNSGKIRYSSKPAGWVAT